MLQNLPGKAGAFISPVFLHFCSLTGSDKVNLALHKLMASQPSKVLVIPEIPVTL